MGVPDHFTCLLRKLYAGQEATVRTGHGTMDWRNINSLRYADDTSLMTESEEELKNFLMKVKEESGKLAWSSAFKKCDHASSSIISWQIEGEKWKQWQIFFSWALKSLHVVTITMKLKDTCSWKESYEKPQQLKLQYIDHLMQRTDSLEKTLMLGKIEGRRRRGQQRKK